MAIEVLINGESYLVPQRGDSDTSWGNDLTNLLLALVNNGIFLDGGSIKFLYNQGISWYDSSTTHTLSVDQNANIIIDGKVVTPSFISENLFLVSKETGNEWRDFYAEYVASINNLLSTQVVNFKNLVDSSPVKLSIEFIPPVTFTLTDWSLTLQIVKDSSTTMPSAVPVQIINSQTIHSATLDITDFVNQLNAVALTGVFTVLGGNAVWTATDVYDPYVDIKIVQTGTGVLTYKSKEDQVIIYKKFNSDLRVVADTASTELQADYSTFNANSTSTKHIPMPIASSTQTGVMDASTYGSILTLQSKVAALENDSFVVPDLPALPTQAQLTNGFLLASGLTEVENGSEIYDIDNSKRWTFFTTYGGGTWLVTGGIGQIVTKATNTSLGIVQGEDIEGKVFVETDGTMSVVGYDELKSAVSTASNLSGLQDVAVGSLSANDQLFYESVSSKWVNAKPLISKLNDVNVISIAENDQMYYDNTSSKWVNRQPLISSLSDVAITSPTSSDLLSYNGTKWQNGTVDSVIGSYVTKKIVVESSPYIGPTPQGRTPDGSNRIFMESTDNRHQIILGDGYDIYLPSVGVKQLDRFVIEFKNLDSRYNPFPYANAWFVFPSGATTDADAFTIVSLPLVTCEFMAVTDNPTTRKDWVFTYRVSDNNRWDSTFKVIQMGTTAGSKYSTNFDIPVGEWDIAFSIGVTNASGSGASPANISEMRCDLEYGDTRNTIGSVSGSFGPGIASGTSNINSPGSNQQFGPGIMNTYRFTNSSGRSSLLTRQLCFSTYQGITTDYRTYVYYNLFYKGLRVVY